MVIGNEAASLLCWRFLLCGNARRAEGMKTFKFAVLIFGAFALALTGCSKEESEQPESQQAAGQPSQQLDFNDQTVAVTVNGQEITNGEIAQESTRLMRQLGTGATPQQMESMKGVVRQQAVDNIINRILLEQSIEKEGIEITQDEIDQRISDVRSSFPSEEEMRNRLAMMGMTEEMFVDEMRTALRVEKLLAKHAPVAEVTEAEMKAFYEENPEQFQQPEQIRASHILFKVEPTDPEDVKAQKKAEAEGVLAELKQGGDFAQLATQHSACPSSQRGGDLGYFGRGRMVQPFEDAAFSLSVGEMTDVVETRFGYHIIKLTERQEGRSIPFEEAKDGLRNFLDGRNKQEKLQAYTDQLRAEALIQYKGTEG
jgi:peptidyl-prolyl cis-trans isomerase C